MAMAETATTAPVKLRGRKPYEQTLPAIREAVSRAYGATGSYRAVERATGLQAETVKRILERNPDAYQAARKKLAEGALLGSEAYLARARATVAKASGLSAVIAAKTLGQMALEQLDKMPSAVTFNLGILESSSHLREDLARELERMRDLPVTDSPKCDT